MRFPGAPRRAQWELARRGPTGFGRRPPREAGSATVAAVGVVMAGMALLAGVLDVARAIATSHRATAAADLAALAAGLRRPLVGEAAQGSGPTACGAAARVAELNGGSLEACAIEPSGSVSVVVSVVSAEPWPWRAVSRARAGPAQRDGAASDEAQNGSARR